MSLTRHDVENIAHLARLAITEAELPVYVDSLSKILSFVEQLNAADTAAVEPMAHPLAEQVQRMRPDEVLDATSTRNTSATRRASKPACTSCRR